MWHCLSQDQTRCLPEGESHSFHRLAEQAKKRPGMLCAWLALSHLRQNGTLASLGELLRDGLPARLLVPGWTGYYGWNYESAVALEALRNPPWHAAPAVDSLLRSQALTPWQPGWWLARHFPAAFLWTAGDRIGLFRQPVPRRPGRPGRVLLRPARRTALAAARQLDGPLDAELWLRPRARLPAVVVAGRRVHGRRAAASRLP